jgi:hypothetical protein
MKMNHCQSTNTARGILSARALVLAAAMLPLIGLGGTAWAQQPAAPIINPGAIEALKTMGTYLRTLRSFTVHAESTTDEVLESGQKIQFANTVDLHARLPDRLRVDVKSDRKQRELYYNGKTVTQYAPRLKYYASIGAPGSVRETLSMAASKYDLNVPLADLFYWGTDQSGIEDIKSAIYIGPSRVGSMECNHYAFRQEGTDWQLWIQAGKTPLPCKLVVTTLDLPSQPQFTTTLRWDLKAPVNDRTFTFVPPKGAQKIDIVPAAATK